MITRGLMLIITALVVLLSVCDGKRYLLVTQKPSTSKESKGRKPSLSVPKMNIWGQKSKSVSDDTNENSNENRNDSVDDGSTKDDKDTKDDTPKDKDDTSKEKNDDDEDGKSDDASKPPEPQTNNQTLYINMMTPPAMMPPHQQGGRPMPYGVTPQRYPSATPPRNKSSSLLSALLGLLLPRPQNIPPGMPGMPPSTPQPIGISPIAIMLLATKIWDFFFSSHSDAFIPSPTQ